MRLRSIGEDMLEVNEQWLSTEPNGQVVGLESRLWTELIRGVVHVVCGRVWVGIEKMARTWLALAVLCCERAWERERERGWVRSRRTCVGLCWLCSLFTISRVSWVQLRRALLCSAIHSPKRDYIWLRYWVDTKQIRVLCSILALTLV